MATSAGRQASLDRITRCAGIGVVLLGVLTLVGWAWGIEAFKSVVPGLITMKANTALAFVLAGAAVGLLGRGQAYRRASPVLAAVVAAIGLAHAAEYALGWDLGIDELLVRDLASARNGLPPGRMALATALAFVLIGSASLLVGQRRLMAAQGLAFVAVLVALFSLVAYLLGERTVTLISPYTSLAVHTALGVFLLAVGILARCAAAGPMALLVAGDAGGAALRRLLPLSVGAILALGLLDVLGVRAGLYSFAEALVCLAVAASAVLAAAIWINSESLSRSEAGRRRELERYRLTLTSIGDAVIATDHRGHVSFLNEVAVELTGWLAAEAWGRPLDDVFRIVNETSREPAEDPVARVLATGHVVGLANHTVLIARDGSERPIADSAAPIRGDDGAIAGVVLVFRDVTEKQQADRMIAEQGRFLELIARGEALPAVLDALCRMVEDHARPPLLASILLAGEGGGRWTLGAAPSLPPAYGGAVEAVALAYGIASAGPAAQLGAPVYVADVAADPLWAGFADLAREQGLRDCWSCPILSGGNQILGIVALFRREPGPPSAGDLGFVAILTRTAAIAIERDRNRAALGDAQRRLETALSAGSIGTWSWDLVNDWIVPDATLARIYSLTEEDAAGSSPAPYVRAIHPDDAARVEQAIGDAVAVTGRYHVEFRIVQPDGSARAVEARGQVEYAPDGRPLALPGVVVDITERKRAEEEKDRLALLVENSGEFIGIATLDGMPTYVNATARRMMGIDDWEADRRVSLPNYFFPEDLPYLFEEFFPRVRAEGYARTEIRLRRFRTHEPVWIDYGVTLLRNWEGDPIAYATISRDLTQQRRAEAERRALAAQAESQARLFNSALANLPDHVYTFDLQGRFVYASPSLLKLWGLTAAEVAGKAPAELAYTPELAARLQGQVLQVVASKERISDEIRYATTDGLGYYEYIFTPVIAPDGSVEAVVGSSRDITDRKRSEEAAQLRASRLHKLADISTRMNAAHDVDSVIRVVSREALGLFGAARAGISMVLNPDFPQPINVVSSATDAADRVEFVPPGLDGVALAEALSRAAGPIRLSRAEVEATPGLARLSRLGDSLVRHGWLASPLLSRDRKTMGLIQLADKQAGEFTLEDESLLVQLSLLASIAIENARLYEELRGNDRRKDEFLAMLAHELRNPLAAISNAVKLIARLGVGGTGADDWSMDVIRRQMHHLTRLIEDLLDVSRISRGKIELRRDLLDATPILESAAATVRGLVDERKHTLELDIDRGNLWLSADPTRLEQVVVNLLNNAAKYSENGGLVRLEARNEGGQVVIRVEDRGVGIPPEKLPQMFELFAQGDRSLARSEGGLGIGLTVVKKLVELHGGTITARSDGPGRGSEFTIRLPGAARPVGAGATLGPATDPADARKARILVVDDNVDTARGMARLLKLIGHTIATAHSGPEAIEVARAHRPEVVLLDIGLPGMSGYEVAARLRQEEFSRGAVIIAVSGYGQDEDRRRSREAGFDHHLTKPLDHDALLALLDGPR